MVPDGSLPASSRPSRRVNTGSAITATTAIATKAGSTGCRSRNFDQRNQKPVVGVSPCGPSATQDRRSLRLSTFVPTKPSSAGSSVNEDSIVSSTVTVAETATPYRNDKPSANCPSNAMHTVRPAKKTARPAVLTANDAACSGDWPALRALRWRVTMNSE